MIYLVRHGQTEFNRDGRVQGRLDSPLTELGVAQAEAAGERLAAFAAASAGEWLIESSPLGRARATAQIIARRMGLAAPRVDPRLIEVSYGALEGLTQAETEARFPELVGAAALFGRAPEGEGFEALAARVTSWLGDVRSGATLVVVTHAGVARVMRGLYLGLGESEMRRLDKPQDVIFRLRQGREDRIECPPLPPPTAAGESKRVSR